LEAFSRFKNFSIVWKVNEKNDVPQRTLEFPHIHVVEWVPQRSLLNHPKLKLFITHGGYNSLLEACHAETPLLMLPLFWDQFGNARRAERHGLGLTLDKYHLTADGIASAMEQILSDTRFSERAKALSSMINDRIISTQDAALHWIRRIGSGKPFPYLSQANKLNFFQYHCLDVIAFLIFVAAVFVYFSFFIGRRIMHIILRQKM